MTLITRYGARKVWTDGSSIYPYLILNTDRRPPCWAHQRRPKVRPSSRLDMRSNAWEVSRVLGSDDLDLT